jgi:hypothetical protein
MLLARFGSRSSGVLPKLSIGYAMNKKTVLIIGLEPSLIDFSEPAYGASGLNASKIMAALKADEAHLKALGYDAHLCLADFGETAGGLWFARVWTRGDMIAS